MILVTGANGFVGRSVCRTLADAGMTVAAAVRNATAGVEPGCEQRVVGRIDGETDWRAALAGVEVVVHLAGHAHQGDTHDRAAFMRTNVDGTRRLAMAACAANVRAFVFMSSIKVNGESTTGTGQRLSGADEPVPQTLYGESKLAAERSLATTFAGNDARVVILRPPLVYGAGQKGNLAAMMRAIDRGWPLPFAGLANRRSLIAVENLATAVLATCRVDATVRGTYTLADVDLSTPALARAIALALNRPARLFAVPHACLALLARVVGRSDALDKLTGDLLVDASRFSAAADWQPSVSVATSLARAAARYRGEQP